jgi:tetratricopeptide (TPR) repeat protein
VDRCPSRRAAELEAVRRRISDHDPQEAEVERKTLLLDLLKQAREMEIDFVGALSSQERARIGTLEDWSAKDIISHITARKALMADGLLAVSKARSLTESEDLDHENAVLFKEYHEKTWDEVLRLAADAFQRVVAQVESFGQQELARCEKFFPWQGERPLWRLIVGSGYIHPIGHMAELHRNRGNREQAAKMIGEMARSMVGLDDDSVWQGDVKYSLACHYSLLGAKAEAIRELQESLALNPGLIDWAKEDPDLDAIRGEPEYQAIYKH